MSLQPVRPRPTVEHRGGATVITFTDGKVRDRNNMIAKELQGLTNDLAGRHLFLNFSAVRTIGSLELATLINLHKKMRASGGQLTLTDLNPLLYEVFTITRLTTFLEVRPAAPVAGVSA